MNPDKLKNIVKFYQEPGFVYPESRNMQLAKRFLQFGYNKGGRINFSEGSPALQKKPYVPAKKLEATIVEEFKKKFPNKKTKLTIKDATYSDGRRRVESPEFKKFKEKFRSDRFVKGEEDILKAYASVRKKLGFKLKKQGPGPWQVLEELK